MSEEKIVADEQATKTEAQPEVEKEVEVASTDHDYEADIAQKDEEIAKLTRDRDSYRKGMLSAKKKLKDKGDDEFEYGEQSTLTREEMVEIAREEAKAALAESQLADKNREKDELIKKMARELKESRLAIKNRSNISKSSQGSGSDADMPATPSQLTPEQAAEVKDIAAKAGLDPEEFVKKVAKNL